MMHGHNSGYAFRIFKNFYTKSPRVTSKVILVLFPERYMKITLMFSSDNFFFGGGQLGNIYPQNDAS